ncbi:MAG: peptidase S10, partial [Armatimonadetes bacterium]|nr:peptidase S10 [Armatimonadota bacterium]
RPDPSNPIPIALNFPTMACTAWYHKRLNPAMQKQDVSVIADEARSFMNKTLIPGIIQGTALGTKERDEMVAGIVKYTGLSKKFVEGAEGKVGLGSFWAELLRDQRLLVGRLDGRFTGFARNGNATNPDFDPSNTGITPVFTTCWNDYVRNELGYKTNLKYYVLGEGLTSPWNFGEGIADTSEALRRAMTKNTFMKVMYCCGYYDFATPFGATEFGVNQMDLDKRLIGNVSYQYYESGHMVYLEEKSRVKFHRDIASWLK